MIFRTLENWPGEYTPSFKRQRSLFHAGWDSTVSLLRTELAMLRASNVVIQAQVEQNQITNEGRLAVDTVANGPAVLLSFTGEDGASYSYPCDAFNGWQDNVRAIALTLAALRQINRYGISRRGEQYQGFRALPAAESSQDSKMSAEEAALFLSSKVNGVSPQAIVANQQLFAAMFELAQRQYGKLQEAAAVLAKHFESRTDAGG